MAYWLLKSEPDVFSIDDLSKKLHKTQCWDGVRNYQARNMLRDQMQCHDLAFFYHSSCQPPGIVGIVEIVRAGYPDPTAFDPHSPYFDPKSQLATPRWYMVDVKFIKKFNKIISLTELKTYPALQAMPLLRQGNRLSILPVAPAEWDFIIGLTQT